MNLNFIRQRLMNHDSAGMVQQRLSQHVLRDLREWFFKGSPEGPERLLLVAPVFDTILQQWVEEVSRIEAGFKPYADTPARSDDSRSFAVAAFVLGIHWGLLLTDPHDQTTTCDLEDALAALAGFALPEDSEEPRTEGPSWGTEFSGPESAASVFEELGYYEPWAEILVRSAWSLAKQGGPRRALSQSSEPAVRFLFFAGLIAGGVRVSEPTDEARELEPGTEASSA
jgi:hypothetical protein